MCRLKAFCFRFSLRSGAIAAAVHTAFGLLSMLGYSGGMLYLAEHYDDNPHFYSLDRSDGPSVKDAVLIMRVVGIVFLIVTLIKLIALFIFCVGIHKNQSRLVLVWLLWTGIEIILLPILLVVSAVLTGDYWILLGLLYVVFMLYLYVATWSYYQDLVEGILRPSPL